MDIKNRRTREDEHTHIHGQSSGITRRVHNILVQLHGLGYYDEEVTGARVQQCVNNSLHLKSLLHCTHTTDVVNCTCEVEQNILLMYCIVQHICQKKYFSGRHMPEIMYLVH